MRDPVSDDRREARPGLPRPHSPGEVLIAFLLLGLRSFGGPIAHLGYFRDEFVARRKWLTDSAFAELIALCQFLPGPASSQAGFAIGLKRAGFLGGVAAWTGFTMPSAIALVVFAYGAHALTGTIGAGLLHGLQIVAVAIVAQALWGMARNLCPDRPRAAIAAIALAILCLVPTELGQIVTLLFGAAAGLLFCRSQVAANDQAEQLTAPVSRRTGFIALACFFLLLLGLPVLKNVSGSHGVAVFEAFYHSGALVFGGGHIVLPLLREAVVTPGYVSEADFLAGYGAAQAVPGPLFSFGAFLGAVSKTPPNGIAGALLGLVAIFLPGILVVITALPFWTRFRRLAWAQAALRGINAAVVGLLAAALYDPIFVSAVKTKIDFGVAALGFILLTMWRVPPILIVALCAIAGVAFG